MTQEEARQAILREWRAWIPSQGVGEPSGRDALAFYQHLRNSRPHLLAFSSRGDRWQVVHGWLLRDRLVSD
jgi:hypothetical protein